VVRNSIILIEFIEDKRKEGAPLRDALVEAATARTRPIFLTAAAGVLSSIVIAADPVWSGLAWALVFGMTASAVLSVIAIPLLYERVTRKASTHQTARRTVEQAAMKSQVTFPELDNFVMESTVLPRMLEGETVQLDAEVFRGEGDAVDGVARLFGPFVVEHAEMTFSSTIGDLQACQRLTLRSAAAPPPAWREVEYA
jgi:phage protein U